MPSPIEVVDKFLSQPEKITEVGEFGGEYYFKYGAYFFSVSRRTKEIQKYGEYSFYVYPKWPTTVGELITELQGFSGQEVTMVAYHTSDEPDLRPFLVRLYKMLEEKTHNVDQIFGDIMKE